MLKRQTTYLTKGGERGEKILKRGESRYSDNEVTQSHDLFCLDFSLDAHSPFAVL
jgi:hypothetical protein